MESPPRRVLKQTKSNAMSQSPTPTGNADNKLHDADRMFYIVSLQRDVEYGELTLLEKQLVESTDCYAAITQLKVWIPSHLILHSSSVSESCEIKSVQRSFGT
jgi:hypothetical protein